MTKIFDRKKSRLGSDAEHTARSGIRAILDPNNVDVLSMKPETRGVTSVSRCLELLTGYFMVTAGNCLPFHYHSDVQLQLGDTIGRGPFSTFHAFVRLTT